MPFTIEDLVRTALVRILPRSRYRLAAQSDARFQSFAANTTRIAYRQQGATPSFLLFSGPGHNPHAAAMAAASWAEQNWRPKRDPAQGAARRRSGARRARQPADSGRPGGGL